MDTGIVTQLKGLEREKARLDALLTADDNWRTYKDILAQFPGRSDADLAAEERFPEPVLAFLRGSRLYQARRKVVDAIAQLEDLLARQEEQQPGTKEDVAVGAGDKDDPQGSADEAAGARGADGEAARTSLNVEAVAPHVAQSAAASGAGSAPSQGDDLTRIRSIDAGLARRLNRIGVTTFAEIARWRPSDVLAFRNALKVGRRISGENWIEQAAVLARGGAGLPQSGPRHNAPKTVSTLAAAAEEPARVASEPVEMAPLLGRGGGGRSVLPLPEAPAGEDGQRAAVANAEAADEAPRDDQRQPVAGAVGAAMLPDVAGAAANDDQPDDLLRLRGMSVRDASLLRRAGVSSFAEIKSWKAADVARFGDLVGGGRRELIGQWIEQAAVLAAGGRTRFVRGQASEGAGEPAAALNGIWMSDAVARPESGPDQVAAQPVRKAEPAKVQPTEAATSAEPSSAGGSVEDEARRVALNERIARLEQTISTIVMPDLKRPPPALMNRNNRSQASGAAQSAEHSDATLPSAPKKPPASVPEKPQEAGEIADAHLGGTDAVGYEEADVKIVVVESTGAGDADGTAREEVPAAARRRTRNSRRSRFGVARRLDRTVGEEDDEADAADFARYSGEIEEASVQIVRVPTAPPTDYDRADRANKDEPSTASDRRPMAKEAVDKSSARRFLNALTGDGGEN